MVKASELLGIGASGGGSAQIDSTVAVGSSITAGQAVSVNAAGEFVPFDGSLPLFGVSSVSAGSASPLTITSVAQFAGTVATFANASDLNSELARPDITTTTYTGNSLVFNGREVQFSADGLKMFTLNTSDIITEYTCATAYNPSSATTTGNTLNVGLQDTDTHSFNFSVSGNKMYTVGRAGDAVYEYNLSSSFDLSTASYSGNSFVPAGLTTLEAVSISPDGLKLFLFNKNTRDGHEFDLGTAFDVSTASTVVNTISFPSGTIGNLEGAVVSEDGLRIYVMGTSPTDRIFEWQLTTAYSFAAGSATGNTFVVSSETGGAGFVQGLSARKDGQGFHVMGFSTSIFEYSTTAITTPVVIDSGVYVYADSQGKITDANTGNFVGFKVTPTQLIFTEEPV